MNGFFFDVSTIPSSEESCTGTYAYMDSLWILLLEKGGALGGIYFVVVNIEQRCDELLLFAYLNEADSYTKL